MVLEAIPVYGNQWLVLTARHQLTIQTWRDRTPAKFRFAWKASKFITHWKRLSVRSEHSIELLISRLAILGRNVGRCSFNYRHNFVPTANGWQTSSTCFRLPIATPSSSDMRAGTRSQHANSYANKMYFSGFVVADHHDAPAPWVTTARHVYVRRVGRPDDTRVVMRLRRCEPGQSISSVGATQTRLATCSLTMMRKSAAPKDAKRLLGLCS